MSNYFQPVISLEKTAANIKRARKEKGYSVKTVAEKIGLCGVQSVYDWESARCLPDIQNFLAISRLYDKTINSILVCEDEDAVVLYHLYYEIVLMTYTVFCDMIQT